MTTELPQPCPAFQVHGLPLAAFSTYTEMFFHFGEPCTLKLAPEVTVSVFFAPKLSLVDGTMSMATPVSLPAAGGAVQPLMPISALVSTSEVATAPPLATAKPMLEPVLLSTL